MKKDDVYKGFKVLDVVYVPDAGAQAIYLRHQKLGLEVLHLFNDDTENTFAFAFRTPSENSTGIAHVLEHSVLCGSEKYPLKDPFLRLTNQSVSTYLNAYTSPDRTVFPASSLVKSDYFNLMSVYGDAVFFPLLRPEIFLQECWRLEYDKKGAPEIQGVVFNEMKGVYSSFENVADYEILNTVCPGSFYRFSSGGDPRVIPSLTHKKLKEFHKKYYVPANCLLYLYGNIPTEEQLDFIDKEILCRIKNPGKPAVFPKEDASIPIKKNVRTYGPCENESETQNVVSRIWRVDDIKSDVELLFMSELLWGDDCAPVSKVLLKSKLGKDISYIPGVSVSTEVMSLGVGLRGVKKEDQKKVDALIMETLRNLYKNGIDKDDIDRTCLAFDFSNREIKRIHGPYSLVLLRRVLIGWAYGELPWQHLLRRRQFEDVKEKINCEPEYLKSLLDKFFLSNKKTSFVVVEPSLSWTKKYQAEEKKIASELLKNIGKETVYKNLSMMHKFQAADESSKADLIPSVKVSELSDSIENIKVRKTQLGDVPLFYSKEHTNGIVYMETAFPIDVLDSKDFIFMPAMAACIADVGWKGVSWDKAQALIKKISAGISASCINSRLVKKTLPVMQKSPLIVGRKWLSIEIKFLEEDVQKVLDLLSECILKTDFEDIHRMRFILKAMEQDVKTDIISSSHLYASSRSTCMLSPDSALSELWNGVSSYYYLKKINEMSDSALKNKMKSLYRKITSSGALIHVTCDDDAFAKIKPCLRDFSEKTALKMPVPKKLYADSEFYNLVDIFGSKDQEVFIIPGTVGYASACVDADSYGTRKFVADEIYAHCLETGELWTKIRMQGGAYGEFFSPQSYIEKLRFFTYRDPKPFDSLDSLDIVLKEGLEKTFSQEQTDKAITGLYASEVEPMTPAVRGITGFMRVLYGFPEKFKKQELKFLLSMSFKDVKKASDRLKKTKRTGKTVVFCPKDFIKDNTKKSSRKIIDLTL